MLQPQPGGASVQWQVGTAPRGPHTFQLCPAEEDQGGKTLQDDPSLPEDF